MKRPLFLYVSSVALAAVAAVAVVLHLQGPPAVTGGWKGALALAMLLALFGAAETAGIGFSAGKARLSAASIPILALVPLFGSGVAVLATALTDAFIRFGILKRPRVKSIFNTCQLTFAVAAGGLTYNALGGPPPVSVDGFNLADTILPFAGLAVVYFFSNTSLVSGAVSIDTGERYFSVWKEIGGVTLPNDLASSSISLFVVFAFEELQVLGILVVVLPLLFVHHSYGLFLRLQRQNREILELLVKTIEAKDPYTSGHSQRVAKLSTRIAELLKLPNKLVDDVGTAALLHDIGKIDFAYSEFIARPSGLTSEERDMIRSHPARGADLLASISALRDSVLDGVRYHHEHYDGNGYPEGLSGSSIPLAARIIMVADTIDAMLSDRPYRSALSVQEVEAELRRFSGRQFDPAIVEAVLDAELLRTVAGPWTEEGARKASLDSFRSGAPAYTDALPRK